MSRAASQDPVEKFRFQLTVLNETSLIDTLLGKSNGADFQTAVSSALKGGVAAANTGTANIFLSIAGFTELVVPKANIGEIRYRENTQSLGGIKLPGLVTYDNVSLKKGVTRDQSLYTWYQTVNDDSSSQNLYVQSLSSFGVIPFQNPNFRKDIIISSLDRSGNFVKHWFLFQAFPLSYKGGDDLNAGTDTKLIEDLVLTYEAFLEVTGNTLEDALSNINTQVKNSGNKSIVASFL